MTDATRTQQAAGLPAALTRAVASIWTRHSGRRPADARTEIRGNVVTCVLVDALDDPADAVAVPVARQAHDRRSWRRDEYQREAIAAVVKLTCQRVTSLVSSHDADTRVATEVFALEPSLARGAPRAERRFRPQRRIAAPQPRAPAR